METTRRGFFGRLIGGAVALVVGPRVDEFRPFEWLSHGGKPVSYEEIVATTMRHYSAVVTENITAASPLYDLLRSKIDDSGESIRQGLSRTMYSTNVMVNKARYSEEHQLYLFPPPAPRVMEGLEWADATQMEMFDLDDLDHWDFGEE